MSESIIIQHFGPIKELTFQDIPSLSIFVGSSGSGKSTIMKGLVLFRWIYKKIIMRSYLKDAGFRKSPFRFKFDQYIRNNGFEGYITKETYILYSRDGYNLEYANKKLNAQFVIDRKDFCLDKLSFISDKRNLIIDLLAKMVKESTSNHFLNETYEDFLEASRVIERIDIPYLEASLIKKTECNGSAIFC